MKILIKTKGGHKQGLGDVVGSVAVAKSAIARGIATKIAVEGEESAVEMIDTLGIAGIRVNTDTDFFSEIEQYKPDAVILNQLNSPAEVIRTIKDKGSLVATIDDVGPAAKIADLRFNPEYFIADAYYGREYIPLNPEYAKKNQTARVIGNNIHHILVTLGGSDTFGFTPKVIRALSELPESITITVVTGPSFQNHDDLDMTIKNSRHKFRVLNNVKDMITLMGQADLAICAAGLTLFEMACLGTPVIVICAEKFEEETASAMEKAGFGINLGFGKKVSETMILTSVKQIISDYERRKIMSLTGKKLVDGKGAGRIVSIVARSVLFHQKNQELSEINADYTDTGET
jgi:spore coat polysaccharide biosynthesis predicted glycosyltransferase SpsG